MCDVLGRRVKAGDALKKTRTVFYLLGVVLDIREGQRRLLTQTDFFFGGRRGGPFKSQTFFPIFSGALPFQTVFLFGVGGICACNSMLCWRQKELFQKKMNGCSF